MKILMDYTEYIDGHTFIHKTADRKRNTIEPANKTGFDFHRLEQFRQPLLNAHSRVHAPTYTSANKEIYC